PGVREGEVPPALVGIASQSKGGELAGLQGRGGGELVEDGMNVKDETGEGVRVGMGRTGESHTKEGDPFVLSPQVLDAHDMMERPQDYTPRLGGTYLGMVEGGGEGDRGVGQSNTRGANWGAASTLPAEWQVEPESVCSSPMSLTRHTRRLTFRQRQVEANAQARVSVLRMSRTISGASNPISPSASISMFHASKHGHSQHGQSKQHGVQDALAGSHPGLHTGPDDHVLPHLHRGVTNSGSGGVEG
ncbi:unnamed protein product, partial [Choristocarpus tenellus]